MATIIRAMCVVVVSTIFGIQGASAADNGFFVRADVQHQSYVGTQMYDNQPGTASSWFVGGGATPARV